MGTSTCPNAAGELLEPGMVIIPCDELDTTVELWQYKCTTRFRGCAERFVIALGQVVIKDKHLDVRW